MSGLDSLEAAFKAAVKVGKALAGEPPRGEPDEPPTVAGTPQSKRAERPRQAQFCEKLRGTGWYCALESEHAGDCAPQKEPGR